MNFWSWFSKSLYNIKLLAYSRFRPITSTIWHVLFSVFIASIPFLTVMNLTAVSGVAHLQETLKQDLPNFYIESGILHTDQNSAYLSEQDENNRVILIDPSDSYTQEQISNLTNGVALTREQLLIFDNRKIQSISYSLLGIQDLTKAEIIDRINDLQGFLPILLGIATLFMYVGLLGGVFIGITVVAFLGMILRRGRMNLHYRHLWVMTAHTMTLPLILLYWIDSLVYSVPITIFFISTYALLFFAISAVPIPKKRASE